MWNLRSLKMPVMLVASGIAVVAALPVKAQQVILTPGGTMFQPTMMPGTEIGGGQPAPAPIVALDPALPSYDILTPEQLKPGKIIFRGRSIEILASDDPRISEQMRSEQLTGGVWVFGEMMLPGYPMASYQPRTFFLAPPATSTVPVWDGNLRVGTKVPGMAGIEGSGEYVIVANDDPRIPENLRAMDLGDFYYWVIDSRSLNPALPSDLFGPRLYSRNQSMSLGTAPADVRPEEVRAGVEQYQRELAWRNPPPDDPIDPDPLIGGPGGTRYSELVKGDKPDSSRTYTPEELAEAYRRGEIFFYPEMNPYLNGFPVANPVADTNLSSQSVPTVAPGGITGATSFSAATASGSGGISGSAISSPLTVFPTVSQPVIANQVASPVTSVTVQASQNPTADFATTRSAPRNPVPEQLNQGIIDSPLSNSRIFPGMR